VPAAFTSQLQILLGQAGGSFQSTLLDVRPPNIGQVVMSGIVARDFNGDGRADLAAAGGNSIYLLAGNGNGTFQNPVAIPLGRSGYRIDAGDLNNDGKLDIVSATSQPFVNGDSQVSVLLGNGNGTFGTSTAVAAGATSVDARLAEFNGDGKMDMVVVNNGALDNQGLPNPPGGLGIYLGNGNGTFLAPVNLGAGNNPEKVFPGDVNGDGKIDLVVTTGDPASQFGFRIAVLLGGGNGTFTPPRYLPTDFGPDEVAIADFNRDGKADLLITHCCGETVTSFMLGNGDGTFQPEVLLAGPPSSTFVITADYNGDTRPDAAVVSNNFGDTGF
jgi:hypothetical protein